MDGAGSETLARMVQAGLLLLGKSVGWLAVKLFEVSAVCDC